MARQQAPSPFRPVPRVLHLDSCGGRIDALGDLHGCAQEAVDLLGALGHNVHFPEDPNLPAQVRVAPGRTIVLLGDLTDRGPRSRDTLRLMEGLLESGAGYAVLGNHDAKLLRALGGHRVEVGRDLQGTLDALDDVEPNTRARWRERLLGLPHQIHAHDARGEGDRSITFVHAAAPLHHQDHEDKFSLHRALYGYADGSTDSHGHLVRDDWAQVYEGTRMVVHGHTPMVRPRVLNAVVCIDTGAVFGGRLTALAVDRQEIVQITSGAQDHRREGFDRDSSPPGTIHRAPLAAFVAEPAARSAARTGAPCR